MLQENSLQIVTVKKSTVMLFIMNKLFQVDFRYEMGKFINFKWGNHLYTHMTDPSSNSMTNRYKGG